MRSIMILLMTILTAFTVFSAFTVFATETVTNTQILDMCNDADNYIDANGAIPQIVYTDSGHTNSVSAAEFYYMMSRWLRYYKNNGNTPPSTVSIIRGTLGPPSPSGTESGTIQLADILAKGESNANFIDSNSQLPNYSTVGSTQYTTKAIFWVFDRTMQWYRNNGSMPTYATVRAVNPPASWTGGPTPTPGPTATPTPIVTPTMGPTPVPNYAPYQIVVTSTSVSAVAKCSCGAGVYQYQAHSFVNYCPQCHKYGTLIRSTKTPEYEGQWTCSLSKGGCDCDYCMQCGKEKISGTHLWLTKIY